MLLVSETQVQMSNTGFNLRYFPRGFRVPNKLLASSLFLGLLGWAIPNLPLRGVSAIAQPAMATSVALSQSAAPSNAVAEQLYGQWQAKSPSLGKMMVVVFTPEGKLFIVDPSSSPPSVVEQGQYQINSTAQPMQLDLVENGDTILTIFEFTADGKLRLQMDDVGPGKFRPPDFSPDAPLFQKIPKSSQPIAAEISRPIAALYRQVEAGNR